MPTKVYLSQANQAHNAGPAGTGYMEKAGMNAITWTLAQMLKRDSRFLVKRNSAGNRVDTAAANCDEANAWGADLYSAWHSNAGGVGARGTIVFYFSTSKVGKRVAKALSDALSPLSPGADHGIAAHDAFIELHRPNAPAVLVELEAHDWVTGVRWLTTQRKKIARAAYEGICRGLDLEPLPAKPATTGKILAVPEPVKKPAWWPNLLAYIKSVKG